MEKEKIKKLKYFIEKEEEFNARIQVKREEFQNQNKDLIMNKEATSRVIAELKEDISGEAKLEFKETGLKKLLGGIGIRVGADLIYDLKEALHWAKDHDLCLQINKKEFEQIAKTQSIEFVESVEKVTVTFPKEIKLEAI